MYCSGCGQAMEAGLAFCPKCGRPIAAPVPPVPGLQFQVESYAGQIRALSIFWFVYAGLSLLLGLAGLTFAKAFFSAPFGPGCMGPCHHVVWSCHASICLDLPGAARRAGDIAAGGA